MSDINEPTEIAQELDEKLKMPHAEFDAWVASMPARHWSKYDLSACRLGWEAARRVPSVPSFADGIEAVAPKPDPAISELVERLRNMQRHFSDPGSSHRAIVTDALTALARAKIAVDAMTPAEREKMIRQQAESWARGMAPCEHGIADWEDCPDCRRAALVEKGAENG